MLAQASHLVDHVKWVKDCLANREHGCSNEELVNEILQGAHADPGLRRRTEELVAAWNNNQFNIRGKFQIMNENDSAELLTEFVRAHLG
jgi:hypothetical protein